MSHVWWMRNGRLMYVVWDEVPRYSQSVLFVPFRAVCEDIPAAFR
jgi:hypothetical protein